MGHGHSHSAIPLDEKPPENAEREPMLLLDTTGSMNHPTSLGDSTPRRETVREALSILVDRLSKTDSQAAYEQEEEGGGLRTITFAGGHATDLGDINPKNLKEKWAKLQWNGGTLIMPGWKKVQEVYTEEFGNRPPKDRPILTLLVITDGEAEDSAVFAREIYRVHGFAFITLAIIGYGPEHDTCVKSYTKISEQNSHVKVLTFDSESNPEVIANSLLKL